MQAGVREKKRLGQAADTRLTDELTAVFKRAIPVLVSSLNEDLSKLRWSPVLQLHDEETVTQSFTFHTKSSEAEMFNMLIRMLLALRELDSLWKLRRCDECERWFSAATVHQKF